MATEESKELKHLARKEAGAIASEILLKIREEKQLSQAELAEISGRKQSYISRVESKQQNISLGTLLEIVKAVGGNLEISISL